MKKTGEITSEMRRIPSLILSIDLNPFSPCHIIYLHRRDQNPFIGALETLVEIFFWFDLIFNFFTAQFDSDGDLITSRMEIAKIYVNGYFWIDFLSNLPIQGLWRLVRTLRLLRLPRVFIRWAFLGYSWKFLNILKLTITITTSGHLVACMFYMVARIENHASDNWTNVDGLYGDSEYRDCVSNKELDDSLECEEPTMQATRTHHYVSALYFAYATLTTVGYGDINAKTPGERSVALIALVLGSAVFAGVVGTMSQLMEGMDEIEEIKIIKLKQVQYFIKTNHFPTDIRVRIRKFFDLKVQQMRREFDILHELPHQLRNDCLSHIYSTQLELTPFLRDCDAVSRAAFCSALTPQVIGSKDYLVVQGQVMDRFYIVTTGLVEVINNRGMICRSIGVGCFFNEKCVFFENEPSAVSYRSKGDVEVLTIHRDDLLHILDSYPIFTSEFVFACKKREELKQEKMDGASKYTVFKNKNSEIMFRPATPPPGVDWNSDDLSREKPPTFSEIYLSNDGSKGNQQNAANTTLENIDEKTEKNENEKLIIRAAMNGPPVSTRKHEEELLTKMQSQMTTLTTMQEESRARLASLEDLIGNISATLDSSMSKQAARQDSGDKVSNASETAEGE